MNNRQYYIFALCVRSLITDLGTLSEVDGYAAWREKEANDLSDLVQRRLDYLQNPEDCSSARKLVCNLNKVIIVM
jgi:glycoprotein 6-alpha-L-fucosyltransferase